MSDAVQEPRKTLDGIYVASRVSHAMMWRRYRSDGVNIVSTWIDEADEGATEDFGELWARIIREIARSRGLVFYGNVSDAPWKGALVEVGAALALGKPVAAIIAGSLEGRSMRPVGSWLHHPLVWRCNSVLESVEYINAAVPSGGECREVEAGVMKAVTLSLYGTLGVEEGLHDPSIVHENLGFRAKAHHVAAIAKDIVQFFKQGAGECRECERLRRDLFIASEANRMLREVCEQPIRRINELKEERDRAMRLLEASIHDHEITKRERADFAAGCQQRGELAVKSQTRITELEAQVASLAPKLVVGDGVACWEPGRLYVEEADGCWETFVPSHEEPFDKSRRYLDYGIPSFPAAKVKPSEPRLFKALHRIEMDDKAWHHFAEWPSGRIINEHWHYESRAEFEAAGWREVDNADSRTDRTS